MIEYITPFLSATMEVLKTMATTEAKPGRPTKRGPQPAEGIISAVIDLTGGTKGSISITFTEECIVGIVNAMLGETYTELNADIEDAVGELVNMISGSARRELSESGFVFQSGTPQCITGEGHTIAHFAEGTLIAIPFKTENGLFYMEACFESQEYFDNIKQAQDTATLKDTNSSLVSIKLQSFVGEEQPEFQGYFLKPNSQIMKPSFFLIPEYVAPTEGNEQCNFTALEVNVCPETFFASNSVTCFKYGNNISNPLLEDMTLKSSLVPALLEMKDKGITIPKSMYSVGRSVENAILSYNLAMRTSECLYKFDSQKFTDELAKIGEYALKAALLSKLIKSVDREKEFLRLAHSTYRKSLPTASGESFFRYCFRLVTLSIYLENESAAKEEIGAMVKYFRMHNSEIKQEEAPRIKRYLQWVDKIYKEKDQFSFTKHQKRDNYRFFDFE
ncbi:MAG: chemotaxis protein CheX [SAR324 cluster bacterium]|nr:chemotaxis protein CheX [SAR324 cluster bacterium]